MMRFVFFLMLLAAPMLSVSQARLAYGAGGVLPAGISADFYMLGKSAAVDVGIGPFGGWMGMRAYRGDWFVGAAHGLQMSPSSGGWRTLPYGGARVDWKGLDVHLGAGVRLDWFDRAPIYSPVFVLRVSRK